MPPVVTRYIRKILVELVGSSKKVVVNSKSAEKLTNAGLVKKNHGEVKSSDLGKEIINKREKLQNTITRETGKSAKKVQTIRNTEAKAIRRVRSQKKLEPELRKNKIETIKHRGAKEIKAQRDSLKAAEERLKNYDDNTVWSDSQVSSIISQQKKLPTVKGKGGVQKIISGGQTGVDEHGLLAAKEMGIKTGGTAPAGYKRNNLQNSKITKKDLKDKFNLEEGPEGYEPRTQMNVNNSDGTALWGNMSSSGSKLTIKFLKEAKKPYITNPDATQLSKFIKDNNVNTLNIAGNRGTAQGMKAGEEAEKVIKETLSKQPTETKALGLQEKITKGKSKEVATQVKIIERLESPELKRLQNEKDIFLKTNQIRSNQIKDELDNGKLIGGKRYKLSEGLRIKREAARLALRLSQQQVNSALKFTKDKVELLKKKQIAELRGNTKEANSLTKEINDKNKELKGLRTGKYSKNEAVEKVRGVSTKGENEAAIILAAKNLYQGRRGRSLTGTETSTDIPEGQILDPAWQQRQNKIIDEGHLIGTFRQERGRSDARDVGTGLEKRKLIKRSPMTTTKVSEGDVVVQGPVAEQFFRGRAAGEFGDPYGIGLEGIKTTTKKPRVIDVSRDEGPPERRFLKGRPTGVIAPEIRVEYAPIGEGGLAPSRLAGERSVRLTGKGSQALKKEYKEYEDLLLERRIEINRTGNTSNNKKLVDINKRLVELRAKGVHEYPEKARRSVEPALRALPQRFAGRRGRFDPYPITEGREKAAIEVKGESGTLTTDKTGLREIRRSKDEVKETVPPGPGWEGRIGRELLGKLIAGKKGEAGRLAQILKESERVMPYMAPKREVSKKFPYKSRVPRGVAPDPTGKDMPVRVPKGRRFEDVDLLAVKQPTRGEYSKLTNKEWQAKLKELKEEMEKITPSDVGDVKTSGWAGLPREQEALAVKIGQPTGDLSKTQQRLSKQLKDEDPTLDNEEIGEILSQLDYRQGIDAYAIGDYTLKNSKGLAIAWAKLGRKKKPFRSWLKRVEAQKKVDERPKTKKKPETKKKTKTKKFKTTLTLKKKEGGMIKRQAGGPVHRGTGAALRGFGKATYSNRLY